jgi:hypothetical protein
MLTITEITKDLKFTLNGITVSGIAKYARTHATGAVVWYV